MAGPRRVLLVEDERSIAEPLAVALGREGFEPRIVSTAAAAEQAVREWQPDLVLLDVMLPDGSGFDVCRRLRGSAVKVPIIMVTARDEETDRVVGLEIGADDYIVKPFSAREVAARIRAVLRRSETAAPEQPPRVRVKNVELDPVSRMASLGGAPLELSRKEFDLLHVLMANAGAVVTREQLLEEVWDTSWYGTTKTLDVHVSGLRKKLGDDPGNPSYLHTVRGVGFRFEHAEDVGRPNSR
jgi:DNA-binding response OmpR family regulator